MQIAVTGANGRIGNVLVRRLLEEGHTVRILERCSKPSLTGLQIERITGEITDPGAVDRLLHRCEVVFHLAARISIDGGQHGEVERINLLGTNTLAASALRQGVRRFIHFGSIHSFVPAHPNEVLDESQSLDISSPIAYNRSKARALKYLMELSGQTSMEIIGLCPTAVIGPGDYEPSYTGQMLLKLYHRQLPMLVHGGYDWVDVRDVVDAATAALRLGRPGQTYLLSGHYASLSELTEAIQSITGRRLTNRIAPNWLANLGIPFIRSYAILTGSEPLYTREALQALQEGSPNVSSARAAKDLNYHVRPLSATLADSYQWFAEHGYLH